MAVSISLSIRLGPMVSVKLSGQSVRELAEALEGFENLNQRLDAMCGDLAERIYPEGLDLDDIAAKGGADHEDGDEDDKIRESL
jgi:hypothetical protein